jgi:FMN-dependent NADH-azoreductase
MIMANILKIDTSLRTGISGTHPHGSLSRRLTELFINQWNEIDSSVQVKHRDLGRNPPLILMKNGSFLNLAMQNLKKSTTTPTTEQ